MRAALRQARRRLRHRRAPPGRARPARRGAPRRAPHRRASARARTCSPRMSPRCSPHPPGHLPRRGRRRRPDRGARGRITGLDGVVRDRPVHLIDWSIESAEKGGYEHFMLKEMHEQPVAIRSAIAGPHPRRRDPGSTSWTPVADAVRARRAASSSSPAAAPPMPRPSRPGSSRSGRAAGPLEHRLRVPLLAAAARRADAGHRGDPVGRDRRHHRARAHGPRARAARSSRSPTRVGSAITREADAVLFLQAGPEIAVVATKTFVTQVTTLVLLAAAVAKARGRLDPRPGAAAGRGAPGAARAGRAGARRSAAPAARARPSIRQLPRLHVRGPGHRPTRSRSRVRSSSRR